MKVAFLDRDGTLIHEPPLTKFIGLASEVEILPGVLEGLRWLKDHGFRLVVVSNQGSGITQAVRESAFAETQAKLEEKLKEEGIAFEAVFMCPHTPFDGCECRKPKKGLVNFFLQDHEIDLEQSIMIGDRETDKEFAEAIGVKFLPVEANGMFPDVRSL